MIPDNTIKSNIYQALVTVIMDFISDKYANAFWNLWGILIKKVRYVYTGYYEEETVKTWEPEKNLKPWVPTGNTNGMW